MMADWQVGDLALCVSDDQHWSEAQLPDTILIEKGRLYTVARVGLCRFGYSALLGFHEDPNGTRHGYIARRFIKVTPPGADADDREVIALLTGKPVEVGRDDRP